MYIVILSTLIAVLALCALYFMCSLLELMIDKSYYLTFFPKDGRKEMVLCKVEGKYVVGIIQHDGDTQFTITHKHEYKSLIRALYRLKQLNKYFGRF